VGADGDWLVSDGVRAALPLLRFRVGADDRLNKERLDYASATDVAVERPLIGALPAAFPAYGDLGEETGPPGSGSRFWGLDPSVDMCDRARAEPTRQAPSSPTSQGDDGAGSPASLSALPGRRCARLMELIATSE
jgi:hypothetical protein